MHAKRAPRKKNPKKKSTREPYVTPPTDTSSPCPICIEIMIDPSTIDGCTHSFCYECIQTWSKSSNTCPLCRERFHKISCATKRQIKVKHRNIGPADYAHSVSTFNFGQESMLEYIQNRFLHLQRRPPPNQRRVPTLVISTIIQRAPVHEIIDLTIAEDDDGEVIELD